MLRQLTRSMRIYTRTGDKGTTGLFSGERLPKDHAIFEALGTNDELSSHLGLSIEHCRQAGADKFGPLLKQLGVVQSHLQDLNSHLATSKESGPARYAATRFDPSGSLVAGLEAWIDGYDARLPRLTTFILPSGGLPGASLHVARAVCRRSERLVQRIVADGLAEAAPAIYLNRLSDYLFMAARCATWSLGLEESIYRKGKP